jgi:hypothetical protein
MLGGFPLHPLMLSVYPIFYLYSRNVMYVAPDQIWCSLALSAAVVVGFLLGFRLILRDWTRAGLLSSLLAMLFFSFGHVAMGLDAWSSEGGSRFDVSALGVGWLLIFLVLSLAIVRTRWPRGTTGMVNLASGLLFVAPAAVTLGFVLDRNGPSASEVQALAQLRGDAVARSTTAPEPDVERPDIYYIVLDGYERADVLLESYAYDNSGFLDGLRGRGFYVADQSRANYLSTNYSLGTSLNLVYFQDLPPGILRGARYNLRFNYVSDFLRQHGYRIVVFDSGTRDTNDQYADLFLAPQARSAARAPEVNPFEALLLRTTLARLLMGQGDDSGSDGPAGESVRDTATRELAARRDRIGYTFSHLADFAASPGADFVFAHIYSPHIPFLYGPSGEDLEYQGDLNVNWYVVRPDRYLEYYRYQVEHLNRTILAAIDAIQRNATRPLVIILQADHGDDFLLDWKNPTAAGVGARSAILNAIYFSDSSYAMLYPSITPVNTFRVVFDKWFATRYGLLPDRTYYHEHPVFTTYSSRLRFQDSCPSFGICAPNPGG